MIIKAADIRAMITDELPTRSVGRPRTNFICTAPEGCEEPAFKRKLCRSHHWYLVRKAQKAAKEGLQR